MLSPAGVIYIFGFWLLLPLACVAAFRWGGWTERIAGMLFVTALILTKAMKQDFLGGFVSLEAGVLLVDGALLCALVVVSSLSGRGWVIWATSFHLVATLGHLSRTLDPTMSSLAYGLMEGASGWPTLLALMVGIRQHHVRRTRLDAGRF